MKAFTLIELLVVVAIIGILAAVGVVAYNGYTASAKRNAVKANHSMASKFIQSEIYKAETSGKISQWDSINKQCKEVTANSVWHTHGQWAFGCLTEDTSRTNPFNNSEVAFKSDWSIPTVVGRTNCLIQKKYLYVIQDGVQVLMNTKQQKSVSHDETEGIYTHRAPSRSSNHRYSCCSWSSCL